MAQGKIWKQEFCIATELDVIGHTNTFQFTSVWFSQHKNSAVNPEGAALTGVLTDLEMYAGLCLSR